MSIQQQLLSKLGIDAQIIAQFLGLGATSLALIFSLPTFIVWCVWGISKLAHPLIFNPWFKAVKNFSEGLYEAKKENQIKNE